MFCVEKDEMQLFEERFRSRVRLRTELCLIYIAFIEEVSDEIRLRSEE